MFEKREPCGQRHSEKQQGILGAVIIKITTHVCWVYEAPSRCQLLDDTLSRHHLI